MAVFDQAPACHRTGLALFSWVSGGLFGAPDPKVLKGAIASLAHKGPHQLGTHPGFDSWLSLIPVLCLGRGSDGGPQTPGFSQAPHQVGWQTLYFRFLWVLL